MDAYIHERKYKHNGTHKHKHTHHLEVQLLQRMICLKSTRPWPDVLLQALPPLPFPFPFPSPPPFPLPRRQQLARGQSFQLLFPRDPHRPHSHPCTIVPALASIITDSSSPPVSPRPSRARKVGDCLSQMQLLSQRAVRNGIEG